MLESIEKMRRYMSERGLFLEYSLLRPYMNEIQAEVDSRYMELPVDADDVPIRIGDKMCVKRGEGHHDVIAITDKGYMSDQDFIHVINTKAYHHVKRTVEDVLQEFAYKVCDLNVSDDSIAKYAAELQMRGDAE